MVSEAPNITPSVVPKDSKFAASVFQTDCTESSLLAEPGFNFDKVRFQKLEGGDGEEWKRLFSRVFIDPLSTPDKN